MSSAGPGRDRPGNPAGFVVGYQRAELSATEALAEFRAAGGQIRTQSWYRLWGEVADTLARGDLFAALPPGALPAPADYGTWAMGRGGQYATQVSVYIRDVDTGLIRTQQYTYVTADPHTPGDAAANAMDDFTFADQEATYGEVVMGAQPTAVWQTVPYEP